MFKGSVMTKHYFTYLDRKNIKLFVTMTCIFSSFSMIQSADLACAVHSIRSTLIKACDILNNMGVQINVPFATIKLYAQKNTASNDKPFFEKLKNQIIDYRPPLLIKWWFDFDINNEQHLAIGVGVGVGCIIASVFLLKKYIALRDANIIENTKATKDLAQAVNNLTGAIKNGDNKTMTST